MFDKKYFNRGKEREGEREVTVGGGVGERGGTYERYFTFLYRECAGMHAVVLMTGLIPVLSSRAFWVAYLADERSR